MKKRVIAILLSMAMMISLMPAAFAGDTAEPVSVTYSFKKGGRSDVTADNGWLEKTVCTPIDALGTETAQYSKLINSAYVEFPTSENAKPGDMWAYIGTSADAGVSRLTAKDTEADTVSGEFVALSTYLSIGSSAVGGWAAFRIKVPKSAYYKISDVQAYKYHNATSEMEIYVVPKMEALDERISKYDASEVLSSYLAGDYYYGKKTGVPLFSTFGNLGCYLMGSANVYVVKAQAGNGAAPLTDCKVQYLEEGKEYYLFLHSKTKGACTISDLTLTECENEETIPEDKTQTYLFGSNYMSAKATDSANTIQYDSFEEVNGELSARWAITPHGAFKKADSGTLTQLSNQFVYFYVNKGLYGTTSMDSKAMGTRPVIALEVKYPGKYDLMIQTRGVTAGTEGDVYILSEKELKETYADYLSDGKVTVDLLKRSAPVGRMTGIGNGETIKNKVGTVELEKGTYYLIMHFASDNPKTIKRSNDHQYIELYKVELTESTGSGSSEGMTPEAISGNASFAASSDILLNGESYSANTIKSIPLGSTVTVKADNADGSFAGWVRGKANSGVYVSSDVEYTFEIMSNTYLTPVYTAQSDAQIVEFWNENGAYIESAEVEGGKAEAPAATLAGYVFESWNISSDKALTVTDGAVDVSAISDKIIRAVAKHTARETVGYNAKENQKYLEGTDAEGANINLDKVLVNGAKQSTYFGDKITCTDNGGAVTHWLRDGEVVSYDATYTHYIWNGTNIYSSYAPVEKKPIILIDDMSIDGAYMIEYDKGNADKVVEAGILFGSTPGIIVSSTDGSKASAQRKENHGQFCASPYGDEAYARGYLIYEKDGARYIIYTNAVSVVK